MPEPDEFMTVAEIAAILKLNQQTIRNTRIYLDADLSIKERALARTRPTSSNPVDRRGKAPGAAHRPAGSRAPR